ncbi:MAG: pyridoxal-phosphate dependent enzyme, partial [Acidimicrobiia bacterium]
MAEGGDDRVSRDDVVEAARLLDGVIRPTPTAVSDGVSRAVGRTVHLKPEHLQRTGSFKIRGAYNRIARLRPGTPVVAASAGNHAQGVALAAALIGCPAVVYMPATVALPKLEATRGYGAEVVLVDGGIEEAIAAARLADGVFVPPFDDPLVVAGQGTVGLELLHEAPGVETLVVPVGGGGLIGGIGVAVAGAVRVVGVEAEGAASMIPSLREGRPVTLGAVNTIADGIATRAPSALTVELVRRHVDEVVTVTDEDISRAMLLLLERSKAVVEPAGGAALAAVLSGRIAGTGPVAVVLSGGNVDPILLGRLIEHGLSAAGRYLVLRVVLDDRPGSLAALTAELARLGLNVLDV